MKGRGACVNVPLNVQGCFSLGKLMKGRGACVYH